MIFNSGNIRLIIQDSIAYCFTEGIPGYPNKKLPTVLGSKNWPKFHFYSSIKNTHIYYDGRRETNFLVEKENERTEWNISAEKKTILGFECTKATGLVNGHWYEVWFTTAIKGGFGPYLMTNLPGIILERKNEAGNHREWACNISESKYVVIEPSFSKKIKQ
jgi:GLPGLI family protein